jgi:RNA polymerase primary sigma factor
MSSEALESEGDDLVMHDLRDQVSATPPLGEAEESELLARLANGDGPSRTRLVAAKLAMVIRLAEARRDRGLSEADLVQEGSLGLVEALRTFDGTEAAAFDAFAERRVGDQMDAAIAAEAAAVRDAEQLVAAATDYERVEALLRRTLQRAPTELEIAQKLEWSLERTRYVAQVVLEARRRHDEELLAFIDPDAIDVEDTVDGE